MENLIKLLEEHKNHMQNISSFITICDKIEECNDPYKSLWKERFYYSVQHNDIEIINKIIKDIHKRINILNPIFFAY